MRAEDRIERARMLYERAVFDGDTGALATADSELDAVEADLALARGRVIHTRFLEQLDEDSAHQATVTRELALFERAVELYRGLADVRGEGEALFWVGCFHQVVRQDDQTAVPILERARELADRPATWARCPRRFGTWASPSTGPGVWTTRASGWRSRPGCAGRSGSCRRRRGPGRAGLRRRRRRPRRRRPRAAGRGGRDRRVNRRPPHHAPGRRGPRPPVARHPARWRGRSRYPCGRPDGG